MQKSGISFFLLKKQNKIDISFHFLPKNISYYLSLASDQTKEIHLSDNR